MGLDSVELVMEVEKYFNIQIPDQQAEKILTVQNMVGAVAGHLSITSNNTKLRDSTADKIQNILLELNLIDKRIALSDSIFMVLTPLQKNNWSLVENHLGMIVPKPYFKEEKQQGLWNKIKHGLSWTPMYEWKQITFEHFVAAICSKNCAVLVNPATIKNMFEIYVAVMSITVDKIGVDEYEITPEKYFTNDLGVD
jgi:acyl carrier protein